MVSFFFLAFLRVITYLATAQVGWSKCACMCVPTLLLCTCARGSTHPIFQSNDVVHIVLSLWASKNVCLNKNTDCTSCCLAGQKELNSNLYCLTHIFSRGCMTDTVGTLEFCVSCPVPSVSILTCPYYIEIVIVHTGHEEITS